MAGRSRGKRRQSLASSESEAAAQVMDECNVTFAAPLLELARKYSRVSILWIINRFIGRATRAVSGHETTVSVLKASARDENIVVQSARARSKVLDPAN
jgi:hypothetical protein